MATCVINQNGYLITASTGCEYVIMTPSEVEQLRPALNGELTINPELYSTVSGWLLLSFISGHVLGRILKTLGKG
jgi:hypothetical protein